MADYYTGTPGQRDIAAQERAVRAAQEKLNRIERMRDAMARQVAEEQKRLDEMRRQATNFTYSRADELPRPNGGAPDDFNSQYDQYGDTPSNQRLGQSGGASPGADPNINVPERLRPIGDNGAETDIRLPQLPEDARPLPLGTPSPTQNDSFPSNADRSKHWDTMNVDPGGPIYVSGYYYSSGAGSKEYEYRVGLSLMPFKVGDMVDAVVHPGGHSGSYFNPGWDRRFIITDIYNAPKYGGDHDVIWHHHSDENDGVLEGGFE